jgi:HKD family nuclease
MKTRRQSRLNVQEALSRHVFHNAVLTTFTFDPFFFEDYCLERFSSLSSNNNISVIVDRGTYESVLATPETQQPNIANIRYLLHPVTVPGRFHAKVFLLTTRTAGRLVFGSANLTRPGLTSNAELVDEYNFEEGKDEAFRPLFREAFEFLNKVAERWPSESLVSNLGELRRSSPWLDGTVTVGPDRVRLLHNLDRSLWSQLMEYIPRPLDQMHVVSRFFDEQPSLIDRVFEEWNPKKVYIYTQNGITTLTRSWLKHSLVKSGRTEILFCTYEDEGYPQALHGKAIVFVSGSLRRLAYGSANFTSAALLSEAHNGNVETLVILGPLGKVFDPRKFIDPGKSAYHLASEDELQTDTNGRTAWQEEVRAFRLREAIVETDRIALYGDFPEDADYSTVMTQIKVPGSPAQSLKMTRESVRRTFSSLPERLVPVLGQKSSVIWLRDDATGKQISNLLLVTNLVDIETHENVRHERHFREAKESASQFFAVLNELLRSGDTGPLLTFLSFCDIPLLNVPRASAFRQRPVWEGREGMRSLGERNLQICRTLHEATLSFFDRHLKKLERHAKTRMLDGIPNFLHIFLSMGNLLRTQIERTVLGIEAKNGPVTVDEWADCRELWDIYFARFRLLMECLWKDYLKKMSIEYRREEIRCEFGPDLEAIHDLCDAMMQFRERIRLLQAAKGVKYGYFHCVLGQERWKHFANEIQAEQRHVEYAVLGTNEHLMPHVAVR